MATAVHARNRAISKCDYCRSQRKKCSPSGRVWPGQKCTTCERRGLSCGPDVRVRAHVYKKSRPSRGSSTPRAHQSTPVPTRANVTVPDVAKNDVFMVPLDRDPDFTGRTSILQELERILCSANGLRIIALTGRAGMGKSQIAVEFAYRVRLGESHSPRTISPTTGAISVASGDFAIRISEFLASLGALFDEHKRLRGTINATTNQTRVQETTGTRRVSRELAGPMYALSSFLTSSTPQEEGSERQGNQSQHPSTQSESNESSTSAQQQLQPTLTDIDASREFSKIFWLSAHSLDQFEKSCMAALVALQSPMADVLMSNAPAVLRKWFESEESGKWLLIVDDVNENSLSSTNNDRFISLRAWLTSMRHGSVLVLSRCQRVALTVTSHQPIKLESMPKQDACDLLRKKRPFDEAGEGAFIDLVEALECLPMAITQAAAFMKPHNTSVKVLLLLLQDDDDKEEEDNNRKSLFRLRHDVSEVQAGANPNSFDLRSLWSTIGPLHRGIPDARRGPNSSSSVLRTLWSTFESIETTDPFAFHLLASLSVLDHKRTPERLLQALVPNTTEMANSIEILLELSLIDASTAANTYSLTQVVQNSMYEWLKKRSLLEGTKQKTLTILCCLFLDVEGGDWALGRTLLPQAEYFLRCHFLLDTESSPIHELDLCRLVGRFASRTGHLRTAIDMFQRGLGILKHLKPKDRPHTTPTSLRRNLYVALSKLGKLSEAEKICREILESLSRRDSPRDYKTDLNNLAVLRFWQQDSSTAKDLLRSAYHSGMERGNFGLVGLAIASNSATWYLWEHQHDEALGLYRDIAKAESRLHRENHPVALTTSCNARSAEFFSSKEMSKDTWQDAIWDRERVLAERRRTLGDEHPSTVSTMADLAVLKYDLGIYMSDPSLSTEALAMQLEASVAQCKLLGSGHSLSMNNTRTLAAMNNMRTLAAMYCHQEHFDEAIAFTEQALEASERVWGVSHESTREYSDMLEYLRTQKRATSETHGTLSMTPTVKHIAMVAPAWERADVCVIVWHHALTIVLPTGDSGDKPLSAAQTGYGTYYEPMRHGAEKSNP